MLKSFTATNPARGWRALQFVFGLIWLIDGILQWQPADFNNFAQMVAGAAMNQPAPIAALINAGHAIISLSPYLANGMVATAEVLIGLALITDRFARPALYASAALAAGIWIFGQGLGMVFMPGATDIQSGPLYILVSVMLVKLRFPSRSYPPAYQ